jgi:hypothetical protein
LFFPSAFSFYLSFLPAPIFSYKKQAQKRGCFAGAAKLTFLFTFPSFAGKGKKEKQTLR